MEVTCWSNFENHIAMGEGKLCGDVLIQARIICVLCEHISDESKEGTRVTEGLFFVNETQKLKKITEKH